MLIRIDSQASEPIYQQIVLEIRRAIARGETGPGDRLPPARDLARSLDVNMHTVLRAYSELREAGDIDVRRGRGAVVLATSRRDPQIALAVKALLDLAERKKVSLTDLHRYLDEGAAR